MDSDGELIERCLQGDSEAWNELFDAHYRPTALFIFKLAPDLTPDDVQEICQECFLSVVRNLARFGGASRLSTWIFRIATNKMHDHRERMNATKRGGGQPDLSLQATDPNTGISLDPAGAILAPDEAMLRRENERLLHDCLDEVGQPCRELLELRYFGDLSYEEIGLELRLNPKTVSSRLSRCLDRLEKIAGTRYEQAGGERSRTFGV